MTRPHLASKVSNDDAQEFTYQWFFAGEPIKGETGSTYSIQSVSSSDLGRYHIEVGILDLPSVTLQSEGAFLVGPQRDRERRTQKGHFPEHPRHSISFAFGTYRFISQFPDKPDIVGSIGSFELPTDFDDEYGVRISGFLKPPKTGEYVFYVVSDDSSQLFLSSDESPDNNKVIANLTGYNVNTSEAGEHSVLTTSRIPSRFRRANVIGWRHCSGRNALVITSRSLGKCPVTPSQRTAPSQSPASS